MTAILDFDLSSQLGNSNNEHRNNSNNNMTDSRVSGKSEKSHFGNKVFNIHYLEKLNNS